MSNVWRSIKCPKSELNLSILGYGQSFRWRLVSSDEVIWEGVASHRIWQLKQDDESLHFRCLGRLCPADYSPKYDHAVLEHYFQLKVLRLNESCERWSKDDEHFACVFRKRPGIRILCIDPFECLLSFICSSNNNIKRITKMVESLCELYGERLDWQCPKTSRISYSYDFPSAKVLYEEALSGQLGPKLRSAGFGYRAEYIVGAVLRLVEICGGMKNVEACLLTLRSQSYEACLQFLRKLPGVGPKVADCVCLMSLEKHQVVPVDTHVLQLTTQHYLPKLKSIKGVNSGTNKCIREFYSSKFGPFAGWVQAALFANELKNE